jgi:hypothetical protein
MVRKDRSVESVVICAGRINAKRISNVAKLRKRGFFDRFQKLSKPNPCLYHCVFSLSSD